MATLLGILLTKEDADRFWAKVDKKTPAECWPWTASVDRLGYGQFKIGGKKGAVVGAHRVIGALCDPCFDETAHYLHSCDHRWCCNPAHLRAGTHQDNMKDMADRGRNHTPRPGNGKTKIDPAEYPIIARLFASGKNKSEIARLYGVTPPRIRQILEAA